MQSKNERGAKIVIRFELTFKWLCDCSEEAVLDEPDESQSRLPFLQRTFLTTHTQYYGGPIKYPIMTHNVMMIWYGGA